MTFIVVLLGWIFSLTLHEFSHAFVAYRGGDYTVKDKGYLTFNPLKYTHPIFSILIPVLFLLLGGIALPGGAVYIETWRLYSRRWETAVSLAGPVANLFLATLLGFLLRSAFVTETGIWPGLAFLAYLQVFAALFNLLPIPPFDGYGALRPHLSLAWQERMASFSRVSMFVVFAIFWYVPLAGSLFGGLVGLVARGLGIPINLVILGQSQFTFWR